MLYLGLMSDLVPLPAHATPITCHWIYRVKTYFDGSLECYNAHLITHGFQREYGPYAHCAHISSCCSCSWVGFDQLDVKNAFLHGDLKEKVCMVPPLGL